MKTPIRLPRFSSRLRLSPSSRAVVALAATLVVACRGGEADTGETAVVLPQTIGEWTRQSDPITYDRETIFDYINGAGEVYRSYAFSQVFVERYERSGAGGVTVEVFDMGDPYDAFGVFSYAREEEEDGIGAGFERKGSILCFWQSRFYVCVAAEQPLEDPGAVLEEVAEGISRQLPTGGERPPLVGTLPPEGLIPFSDRYFHLHQTLNYNYYLVRENVLNLSPETNAVLARYTPGSTYLVLVEYGTETSAGDALSSFREAISPGVADMEPWERDDGTFVSSSRAGPFLAVVLGADTEATAESILSRAKTRLEALRK